MILIRAATMIGKNVSLVSVHLSREIPQIFTVIKIILLLKYIDIHR